MAVIILCITQLLYLYLVFVIARGGPSPTGTAATLVHTAPAGERGARGGGLLRGNGRQGRGGDGGGRHRSDVPELPQVRRWGGRV